jgi:hypothetical protein
MSNYTAEDPEGRGTATAAQHHDEAAAAGEPRGAFNELDTDEDPDVVVLGEEDVVVLDDDPLAPAGAGRHLSPAANDPRMTDRGSGPDAVTDAAGPGADQAPGPADAGPASAGAATGPGLTYGDVRSTGDPATDPATASSATADPVAAAASPGAAGQGPDDPGAPAVAEPAARTAQLQERWLAIQSDFVDDPRRSVAAAADLVTEAIDRLVADIRERDASLRGSWDGAGTGADTEVLRNSLREYRTFLDRLVAL